MSLPKTAFDALAQPVDLLCYESFDDIVGAYAAARAEHALELLLELRIRDADSSDDEPSDQ
jgi:hypothetical protein